MKRLLSALIFTCLAPTISFAFPSAWSCNGSEPCLDVYLKAGDSISNEIHANVTGLGEFAFNIKQHMSETVDIGEYDWPISVSFANKHVHWGELTVNSIDGHAMSDCTLHKQRGNGYHSGKIGITVEKNSNGDYYCQVNA